MEVGDAKATVCRSPERRDRIGRVASGATGDPAQHVAVVRKRWDVRSGKAKNRAESPEGMEARSEAGLEGKIKGLLVLEVK